MDPQWTGSAAFWVSLAATFIALFAAFVSYVVYRSQADPEVIVYPEGDDRRQTFINLVVANVGKAPAYDVRFTSSSTIPWKAFGLDAETAQTAESMTKGPLVSGVPFLPPGGKRTITWGQYGGLLKALGEDPVLVSCHCKSRHILVPWRIKHVTTCPLEIVSFAGTDASEKNYAKLIADNIEKLAKAVEKGAGALRDAH